MLPSIEFGMRGTLPKTPVWRKFLAISAHCLVVVIIGSGLSGCAAQKQPNGKTVFSLDEAVLFGAQVSAFSLPNGNTGALRLLNGTYSVKLDQFQTVISVGQPQTAKVLKAEIVGDRTNILVEKGELGCAFKYLLVSIRGTDVSTWDFQGDCRTQPIITINGAEQQFEFVIGNQLVSYVNRDDRFLRRARPIVRPPLATPTPAPAFSATPAAAETRSNNRKSARAAGPVQRPAAPGPSRMQAPPAAPVLEFPALEQKPVRIILDK